MAKQMDDLTIEDIKVLEEEKIIEKKVEEKEEKKEEKKVKEEKKEEKIVDEKKEEKKEEKIVDEKKEEKKEEKIVDEKKEEKKVEDKKDELVEGYTPEEIQAFNSLSEETGVKVTSDDEIINSLKELSDYRAGKIPGVSPTIVKAIEIEKQGGNLTAFFRALSREPDKMDERELLREAFLEKSERAKTNIALAGKDFERDIKKSYGAYLTYEAMKGKTEEERAEKEEFYEKNSEDIDYQKELYAADVAQAKKHFKEMQEKFPVEKKENGMTQAQVDELVKKHEKESEAAIKSFKGVEIPISGEDKFTVGLSEKTKPIVSAWLSNPETFLNAIGMHPDRFDLTRLRDVMAVIADISSGDFGERFQKHALASKNIKTLEEDLDVNAKKISRSETASDKGDLADQIAEAFDAKRGGK